jgi:phage tail-like protein
LNRADIESLLPENYRRAVEPQTPLSALIDVMDVLQAPTEAMLVGLDRYFASRRTPDRFVPFLARWVDLTPLFDRLAEQFGEDAEFPSGTGRLRELVAVVVRLSLWRGTRRGLLEYLEVATGLPGFELEEDAGGRPFHLRFVAPPGAEAFSSLIETIVEQEKPVHTTYEIAFGGY